MEENPLKKVKTVNGVQDSDETRLQHEWTKRSSVLDDEEGLEKTEIVVNKIFRLKIPDLCRLFPDKNQEINNVRPEQENRTRAYYRYVQKDEIILSDIIRHHRTPTKSTAFARAGPREKLFFDPKKVRAGIVTCGQLSPGLNNVIRELVRTLYNLYNVEKIFGFKGGYAGVHSREPVELTEDVLADVHHKGGTMLSSSRGGFDLEKIYESLKKYNITQFYLIGGDGYYLLMFFCHNLNFHIEQ